MDSASPYVLSVGGFDPSGGAGVLADCKTFEMIGTFGMAVCSALTYQHESSFFGMRWISVAEIQKQLEPLLSKYTFGAAKIGIIRSCADLCAILTLLHEHNPRIQIVWDPVLKASAGFTFHTTTFSDKELTSVYNHIAVVTPNQFELKQLLTQSIPTLKDLSRRTTVLLTGGNRTGAFTCDELHSSGTITRYQHHLDSSREKHGSGCILSSALAAYLGHGYSIEQAVGEAIDYTTSYVLQSTNLLGMHNRK